MTAKAEITVNDPAATAYDLSQWYAMEDLLTLATILREFAETVLEGEDQPGAPPSQCDGDDDDHDSPL